MLFLDAKAFPTYFQHFRLENSTLPLIFIADALMNYSPLSAGGFASRDTSGPAFTSRSLCIMLSSQIYQQTTHRLVPTAECYGIMEMT